MDRMTFMTLLPKVTIAIFIFIYGACIGSLVNVLVYRLPRGLGIVTPPSRCPTCDHKLTFRENIPVFGWLILRGKCRFCKNPISPEYPIVEAFTGLLFLTVYLLFYALPETAGYPLHIGTDLLQPEWASNGLAATWPELLVVCVMLGCLVAITLIDARTAQIPLILVWVPAITALLFYTGHAIWIQSVHGGPTTINPGQGWRLADGTHWNTAPGAIWSIPTPGLTGWRSIGAALGGAIGLIVAILLMGFGFIRRSFDDYEQWEKEALAEAQAENSGAEKSAEQTEPAGTPDPESKQSEETKDPELEPEREPSAEDADFWIQYPHARREMFKEIAFLAPPAAFGVFGMWLAPKIVEWVAGPPELNLFTNTMVPAAEIPLWLSVLAGVLLGYLVGGAVVWGVRILGSLAFGKEALGMGDVHLVAAIGASIGWVDAVLGFFGAAFVGLAWTLFAAIFSGKVGRTLPYGPYIAIATVLVYLGKPGVEWFLSRLMGAPINLP
jgi:leader peptidase (prepilin peptidase) / N-methyltransferase